MNELGKCYDLDECGERKQVVVKLKQFEKEGKIEYSISGDVLKIEDIDLEDNDITYLIKLFEDNDIFENTEYDEDDDYNDDYDDYNDYEE
jgi:hypothetical protein